jgi:3-oxoacyl-[acyl-carrier-protein] synthase II
MKQVRYKRHHPVISGIGILTCMGASVEEVWDNLLQGKSGIVPVDGSNDLPDYFAGKINGQYPLSASERMAAFLKTALINCIDDACVNVRQICDARSMLVYSTSLGAIFDPNGKPAVLDEFVSQVLQDVFLDIPYLSLSSACSSSSDAICTASDLINYQGFDVVICGGVDVLDKYKIRGHAGLSTLSAVPCAPFSKNTDGTTLGEGACFMVLTGPDFLSSNDLKWYGAITGKGNSTDIESITSPDNSGKTATNAIVNALEDAGVLPSDVAYINAHGSGTPINDKMENKIYKNVFSSYMTPISSTKGAFGHLLGATGAIEAMIAVMALQRGVAPPTVNLTVPDEQWIDTGLIYGSSKPISKGHVSLSMTYGFGGANTCLVFER